MITHTNTHFQNATLVQLEQTNQPGPSKKKGFLPTTSISTPYGWTSAASILPGDIVLTPAGEHREVQDVLQTSFDPYEMSSDAADRPVLIPSYGIGNLTELVVLADQELQIPSTIMGLQQVANTGPIKARDLVGHNGVRHLEPEEVPTAINLVFAEETIVSCAHGALAVCNGTIDASQAIYTPALAA